MQINSLESLLSVRGHRYLREFAFICGCSVLSAFIRGFVCVIAGLNYRLQNVELLILLVEQSGNGGFPSPVGFASSCLV